MTAIELLLKANKAGGRVVSSGDMTTEQIAESQRDGLFFVDDASGLGWAVVPWDITTAKDRDREREWFSGKYGSRELIRRVNFK